MYKLALTAHEEWQKYHNNLINRPRSPSDRKNFTGFFFTLHDNITIDRIYIIGTTHSAINYVSLSVVIMNKIVQIRTVVEKELEIVYVKLLS